jgi:hypothetical protein
MRYESDCSICGESLETPEEVPEQDRKCRRCLGRSSARRSRYRNRNAGEELRIGTWQDPQSSDARRVELPDPKAMPRSPLRKQEIEEKIESDAGWERSQCFRRADTEYSADDVAGNIRFQRTWLLSRFLHTQELVPASRHADEPGVICHLKSRRSRPISNGVGSS